MHTSFEDLRVTGKEGEIYRRDENGKWIWERPRTRREAVNSSFRFIACTAIAVAVPLAVALVLMLT